MPSSITTSHSFQCALTDLGSGPVGASVLCLVGGWTLPQNSGRVLAVVDALGQLGRQVSVASDHAAWLAQQAAIPRTSPVEWLATPVPQALDRHAPTAPAVALLGCEAVRLWGDEVRNRVPEMQVIADLFDLAAWCQALQRQAIPAAEVQRNVIALLTLCQVALLPDEATRTALAKSVPRTELLVPDAGLPALAAALDHALGRLQFTGERFTPETRGEIFFEHWHRYVAVAPHAAGKRVLDVASGEGYGSALLARHADQVIGVDVDGEAVRHARQRYRGPANLHYVQGSALALPIATASVDLVVSFETLEHLAEHQQLLGEFTRVLRPDGALLISSPNRVVYSEEANYHNEFHVKELDRDELRALIAQFFRHVVWYGQQMAFHSLLWREQGDSGDYTARLLVPPDEHGAPQAGTPPAPKYFLLACAHRPEAVPELAALTMFDDPERSLLRSVYASYGILREQQIRLDRQQQEIARLRAALAQLNAQLAPEAATARHLPTGVAYALVIPIYRAADAVARCLQSVAAHTPAQHPVLLIDDASQDPALDALLERFRQQRPNTTLLRNPHNLGFVGTVNRGIEAAAGDVVVLNSDTEVTAGWLDALDAARCSAPEIGIVCPLSNRATLLSVPDINSDAEVPSATALAAAADQRADVEVYPHLPTAVGFCMLLTRQLIDRIGLFDPAFGRGYGEENDYSLRAWQAGFEVVAAPAAYVVHHGSASFSQVSALDSLRRRNARLLDARWPQYRTATATWCRANPLRFFAERAAAQLSGSSRPRVLTLIHRWNEVGGTELHTRALLEATSDEFDHTVAYPKALPQAWADFVPGEHGPIRELALRWEGVAMQRIVAAYPAESRDAAAEAAFAALLAGGGYSVVHFQHLAGWNSLALPKLAKQLGRRVVVSAHDYFLLCPRYNLTLPEGRRCGKARAAGNDAECRRCLGSTWEVLGNADPALNDVGQYLTARNTEVDGLIDATDTLVVPSEFVAQAFRRAFGQRIDGKLQVIPHLPPVPVERLPVTPAGDARFRVVFPGPLITNKGADAFLRAIPLLADLNIEWTALGRVETSFMPAAQALGVKLPGPYAPDELSGYLAEADLAVVTPIVDETFCLAITQAQLAGVPVLASRVGAIPERVIEGQTGFLVDADDPRALALCIRQLVAAPERLAAVRGYLRAQPATVNFATNADVYRPLYRCTPPARTTAEQFAALAAVWPDSWRSRFGGDAMRALLDFDSQSPARLGTAEYARWQQAKVLASRAAAPISRGLPFPLLGVVLARQGIDGTASGTTLQQLLGPQAAVITPASNPGQAIAAALAAYPAASAPGLLLLPAGDLPAESALAALSEAVHAHPGARLFYGDDDLVSTRGEHYAPRFKPAFDPCSAAASPLIDGLVLVTPGAIERLELSWRAGAEALELALQLRRSHSDAAIRHLPALLSHRQDFAWQPENPDHLNHRAAVVAERLEVAGANIEVAFDSAPDTPELLAIRYQPQQTPPIVVVLPVAGISPTLTPCLDALLEKTQYPDFRVVVAAPVAQAAAVQQALAGQPWANAVSVAGVGAGDLLSVLRAIAERESGATAFAVLTDEIEITDGDWLDALVAHLPRAAMVGPAIVDRNDQLLGLLVLGLGGHGIAGAPNAGEPAALGGYLGRNRCVQRVSVLTDECLLIRRELLLAPAAKLPLRDFYPLLELALAAGAAGEHLIWTPQATVRLHGPGSFARARVGSLGEAELQQEADAILAAHLPALLRDPAYHPELTLKVAGWQPEACFPDLGPRDQQRRVLGFSHNEWASGDYRVRAPLRALHRAGHVRYALAPYHDQGFAPSLTTVARLDPDVVLFHYPFHDYQLAALEAYRRIPGLKLVVGMDDRLDALPPWNPFHHTSYRDLPQRIAYALSLADVLVVTTDELAAAYKGLARQIVVIPNRLEAAVWRGLQPVRPAAAGARIRVGWAGARQHAGDLELLVPVVKATADRVDWVFFGMCPDVVRPLLAEYHEMGPLADYPRRLAALGLDLALAPLAEHPFNDAKSNLRLLEYGVLGYPVLCSDLPPYRNSPAVRLENRAEAWIEAIRRYAGDEQARTTLGAQMKSWFNTIGFLEDHLGEWIKLL